MTYITFSDVNNKKLIESKFNVKLEGFYIPLKEKLSQFLELLTSTTEDNKLIIDLTDLDIGRIAYFSAIYNALDSLDYTIQVVVLRGGIMMDITHHYAFSRLVDAMTDSNDLTKDKLVCRLKKFESITS